MKNRMLCTTIILGCLAAHLSAAPTMGFQDPDRARRDVKKGADQKRTDIKKDVRRAKDTKKTDPKRGQDRRDR